MARGLAVDCIQLRCYVWFAVLAVFAVPSCGATLWKQALVEARYSGNPAKQLAAFYSKSSLFPYSSTGSGNVTYQLVHDWSFPDLCSTSTGHNASSNAPISLENGPFALLAHIGNCSVDVKISEAISRGAGVLLLYDENGPTGSRTLFANSNPLRVESSSGFALQTIGVSINDGDVLYSALLRGLTQGGGVSIKITPRVDHTSSVSQMEALLYFQLCMSVWVATVLGGILMVYWRLYVQTLRMTLSQRSRADQARDILNRLPERTLDESIIEDEDHVMCVVCIDNLETGDTIRILPCNPRHRFHKDCIDRWLVSRQTCPLCKYNILSGEIEEEEEMDVQDAAAEIARGHMPSSVLDQAAALPLPPSRLSMFMDSGWLQHDRSGASPSPSLPNVPPFRMPRAQSLTPEVSTESFSSNVILLDHSSPTLLASVDEDGTYDASSAVPDASQSSLSSRSIVLRPDGVARPSTRGSTWRVAFSRRRAAQEVRPRSPAQPRPAADRSPLATLTGMFTSALGPRQVVSDTERQPLSSCGNVGSESRDDVEMM